MSRTEQLFLALLRSAPVKDHLLPHLSTFDLCSVRQLSSACCNLVSKRLFTRIHVTFTASTFTKPCRVAALHRIGHHVEHVVFHMPHSESTFLPPLVHPLTGQEICFLYTPHTSMASALTRPKYANTELGDILTQQYPPLFHAATNVPSFINAFKSLVNTRHLTVRCPGQHPRERYRRDTVDYALISLRIAVERAPLDKLNKVSLSSVHPGAFNYLRHTQGFGSVPSASRRWKQVKKLNVSVESWDFYGSSPGLDHLKIIDDYVRFFAPGLEKFSFSWIGNKGPCSVALSSDALFAPPKSSKKLFHEVTSPMSPLPVRPPPSPIHFPKLRHLQIRNTYMNAPQLSELIKSHSRTVKEFDFENVVLANNGSWDEALAPLSRDDSWARSSRLAASECSFVTDESSEDLPSPSAAVEAASRQLLDLDLGGFNLSDEQASPIGGLCEETSAAAAARADEAMSFTTKLRKKSQRRRRRKHHSSSGSGGGGGSGSNGPDEGTSSDSRPSSSHHRHERKPSRPKLKPSLDSYTCRSRPVTPPLPSPKHVITAPILSSDPQPVLLQPTTYDPTRSSPDGGITSVQRNLEQEEAHRLLAEDATARVNALRKAKDAVLSKLSREFCARRNRAADAVAACRLMVSAEWTRSACSGDLVLEDGRGGRESQSALVPLMFSRS
ncbi:uncharacterized protein UV8b_00306 [Ustilaginoidea virens]|uniref:F-box domain-containing protein n=1 Tax=Ustilaginoidea virens TaxID=1159556 RepID=A0A063BY55_USTVR|nr:uncharacterized protein UV8b_00306 [Ustilaginoidea virens]QUC16065.1 hypothetical protein UV8b_00306 [Ustilaginoidea virens]GAO17101.1 hypothetical protein UVI_02026340 [Ustilaginoidea virens]